MSQSRLTSLLLLLALTGCSGSPVVSESEGLFNRYVQYLPNKRDSSKRVEFFLGKPDDGKRHPALVFVHPNQFGKKSGGFQQVEIGRFQENIRRGYVAVAISQPGFGGSDGPADYSGPLSQGAVETVLDYLIQQPYVDASNIALYGFNRGALTAALTAAHYHKFKALILGAAEFNLIEAFKKSNDINFRNEIQTEAGGTEVALQERTVLNQIDHFALPILIIHGERDQVAPLAGALTLYNELRRRNIDAKISVLDGLDQNIPGEKRYAAIYPFLEEFLSRPTDAKILEEAYLQKDSNTSGRDFIKHYCESPLHACAALSKGKALSVGDLKNRNILKTDFETMPPGAVAFFKAPRGKREVLALYTGRHTMDGEQIFFASGHPKRNGWVESSLQDMMTAWNMMLAGWINLEN